MLEANRSPTCSTALEGKVDTCPQTMPVRRNGICSTGLRLRSDEGMELRYPIGTAG